MEKKIAHPYTTIQNMVVVKVTLYCELEKKHSTKFENHEANVIYFILLGLFVIIYP